MGKRIEGQEVLEARGVRSLALIRSCRRARADLRPPYALRFYSQLYLASSDKHVVHHLTIQLELLPGWTTLVTQRVGEPDGPLTEEFELTEEELDWCV